jgi:DNA-binding IclR family transcriptional regulator
VAGNAAEAGRSVTSKVIAILLTFADGNVHSLTEMARLAGLPISTVHRLAAELAAWGVLERTDESQYRVGLALRMIGSRPVHPPNLQERARRAIEDLAAATRTDARLGVLQNFEVAYVEKLTGPSPVSAFSAARTLPAHATAMGKALLAFSPQQTVDAVIARGLRRYTTYTVTSPDRLRRTLSVTRLTRTAISRGELDLTCTAIAVPVFGPGGGVAAALELRVRDLRSDLQILQPALAIAARALSRDITTAAPPHRYGLTFEFGVNNSDGQSSRAAR